MKIKKQPQWFITGCGYFVGSIELEHTAWRLKVLLQRGYKYKTTNGLKGHCYLVHQDKCILEGKRGGNSVYCVYTVHCLYTICTGYARKRGVFSLGLEPAACPKVADNGVYPHRL